MTKRNYVIEDQEIHLSSDDAVPGVSYRLDTTGQQVEEMICNSEVIELDDDGVEIDAYSFYDASDAIQDKIVHMIQNLVARA